MKTFGLLRVTTKILADPYRQTGIKGKPTVITVSPPYITSHLPAAAASVTVDWLLKDTQINCTEPRVIATDIIVCDCEVYTEHINRKIMSVLLTAVKKKSDKAKQAAARYVSYRPSQRPAALIIHRSMKS